MATVQIIKRAVLHALRACGVFSACERLTSSGLQILCYHGISVGDEHRFRPKLFMRPDTFAARMDWLADKGYRVIGLQEAVDRLFQGKSLRRSIVLTFDDGWFGCLHGAFEKLASLRWPATLYVTTYYAQQRLPVFNVAVDYLMWRSTARSLDLRDLGAGLEGRFDLGVGDQRALASDKVRAFGDETLGAAERNTLLYRLAQTLGQDPVDLFERQRAMTLMSLDELSQVAAMGIDLQLHTHRHRFPTDDDATIRRELQDNRDVLAGCHGHDFRHFCYPSGVYHPRTFPALRAAGVSTATTTHAGINFSGADPLALSRFLDGENVSPIEFESEVAGFYELHRQLRAGTPPWAAHSPLTWRRAAGTRFE